MLRPNIALLAVRNSRRGNVNSYFVADKILDKDAVSPFDNAKFFPLFLHLNSSLDVGEPDITPSLNLSKVQEVLEGIQCKLKFDPVNPFAKGSDNVVTPLDIFDYIYAVLYCKGYRTKYGNLLAVDLPRIPYPSDVESFWNLAILGSELRKVHTLESPALEHYVTSYPVAGDNVLTKPKFRITDTKTHLGRVWINSEQYFDNVPAVAWNLHIGGYQPAQKWLKDRTGRTLTYDDILHYQKIIVALVQTEQIMQKIDEVYKLA
jgi:predicted helicase